MDKTLQDAVAFFKEEPAYDKLFSLFRKKYESLGRIGGTVSVSSFSDETLHVIGAFFGKSVSQLRERGSISLRSFDEQLVDTRFSDVDLLALLEGYFGEKITSKKEQEQERRARLSTFMEEVKYTVASDISFWLDYVQETGDGRWIMQLAEQDNASFANLFGMLNRAYRELPASPERLPIFSQRITGDPHAFDAGENAGRMLMHLLAITRARALEQPVAHPVTTEETNALYEAFHIYRDDLLNFVTCANLIARDERGAHPVWEAAASNHTVQIVPIREILPLTSVAPAFGDSVFIVENSGVCATLLDQVPHAPMICSNGQFTLATWLLLEKLVASGTHLYYAGDFDPEGLRIADRLMQRFGANVVHLWHMDVKAYEQSNPRKALSKVRLEKVNGLVNEALHEVGGIMKRLGKAGYQEALVEAMIEDLKNGEREV